MRLRVTPRAALLFGIVVSACHQYRTIPLTEAPKLSESRLARDGSVVVEDVSGNRVRIRSFRYFDVRSRSCEHIPGGTPPYDAYCGTEYSRHVAPVEVVRLDGMLKVTSYDSDAERRVTRLHHNVQDVRLAEPSETRPLIIVGVLVLAFAGAAVPTALALDAADAGHVALFLPIGAGALAGGLSLAITIPMTRGLGDVQ